MLNFCIFSLYKIARPLNVITHTVNSCQINQSWIPNCFASSRSNAFKTKSFYFIFLSITFLSFQSVIFQAIAFSQSIENATCMNDIGCSRKSNHKPTRFSTGTEVLINYFYAQLSRKFILLINVKMPTIVGILTFISRINISDSLKARNILILQNFNFYEHFKFYDQLS